MVQDRAAVSVGVFGSGGCGKTTAIADLCQRLGGFAMSASHKINKDLSAEFGRKSQQHAWMFDMLREERERGVTLVPTFMDFETGSSRFVAIDTPGTPGLFNNMVRVLSLTDIAVLVVPAPQPDFEADLDSGYIKEIALACFTMGVKNVLVLVTKMDDLSVSYANVRFELIKKEVNTILKDVGYKQKDPTVFVPVSGTLGDNMVEKSAETGWYSGPSVVDALDSLAAGINRPAEKPLRLPVLKVHEGENGRAIIVGRVEAGCIRTGASLTFSPSGKIAEVKSLQINGRDVNEAGAGDIVGVSLSGARCGDLRCGMVASSKDDAAAAAETFVAQVILLDFPGVVREGYCPAISIHTAQVPCEFEELLSKIDRKTGKDAETAPVEARKGEVITARLRPRAQVCVETFAAYPSLGRFAVRDHNRTIAVGVIKEVTKRPIPTATESNDDEE